MNELAASGIPIAKTLKVLGFSRQAFYEWQRNPVSDRDWVDAHLTNAAIEIHREDPEFGYRFVADELRTVGWQVSEKHVWRICSQAELFSFHAKKRGKGRRPGPPVHDDLVQRQFRAEQPNELWLTDITEHPTREGKLYLCAIKDVFGNKIVGYAMGERMTRHLAVAALNDAVARRGRDAVRGCIVHSDRGSQGGFNWLSQHLDLEVFDGEKAAGCGSCAASEDAVAWPVGLPAAS